MASRCVSTRAKRWAWSGNPAAANRLLPGRLLGLVKATDGKVAWLGKDLLGMKQEEWRDVRSDIQMIFQDPLASLNPRMTIGEIIAEPLRTYHPKMSRQEVRDRVKAMMMKVGLLPNLINRYPHEFSRRPVPAYRYRPCADP
ncbi:oligopeptide/dipeptide ABC transporter ATPase [Raoultella ornithinolytica]|nr:oligopeptide/dipeptide ABC transporter ATPase [Raoultella ornithinolytica]